MTRYLRTHARTIPGTTMIIGLSILMAQACSKPSADEVSTVAVVSRVADRIIESATFRFEPVVADGAQQGFYTVDFFDALDVAEGGVYFAAANAERLEPVWDRFLGTPELRALFNDIRAIDETGS